MYCSQGDQRFRFLLNRFWAAPSSSKVCWLALLTSHSYRKLSKKWGNNVCLKSLEQKCLIQQLITKVETPCCHSCSMQAQALGEPQTHLRLQKWSGHSQPFGKNVGFAEQFQGKLTRNQFKCCKTPTECLQRKWRQLNLFPLQCQATQTHHSVLSKCISACGVIQNALAARKCRISCLLFTSTSVVWLANLDKETTQRQIMSQTSALN